MRPITLQGDRETILVPCPICNSLHQPVTFYHIGYPLTDMRYICLNRNCENYKKVYHNGVFSEEETNYR